MRAAPSWASAAATASLWKTLRPVARHGSAQLHGITGVCGAFRAARGSRKESLLSGGLRFARMAAPRPRLGPTGQDGHLQPQVGRVAIGGGHQPQVRPGTPQIHGQLAAAAHRFQAGPGGEAAAPAEAVSQPLDSRLGWHQPIGGLQWGASPDDGIIAITRLGQARRRTGVEARSPRYPGSRGIASCAETGFRWGDGPRRHAAGEGAQVKQASFTRT